VTAVFEGLELAGKVNVPDTTLLENVRSSIRRGHPQVWPSQLKSERVCLVGGGPSLDSTFGVLRDLHFAGAKIVTVNGSYQWCLDRNIRPNAQIVLDARPSNARFVDPPLPLCRYYLCSQCAPETWDAVAGREFVAIWHDASDEKVQAELDAYFMGKWLTANDRISAVRSVRIRFVLDGWAASRLRPTRERSRWMLQGGRKPKGQPGQEAVILLCPVDAEAG
jgi:hypothetical protein